MSKQDNDRNKPMRQCRSFRWAGLWAGLGQLALYLSLVACLWVVLVAIGLALCRKTENDHLGNVYKPMP